MKKESAKRTIIMTRSDELAPINTFFQVFIIDPGIALQNYKIIDLLNNKIFNK